MTKRTYAQEGITFEVETERYATGLAEVKVTVLKIDDKPTDSADEKGAYADILAKPQRR